MRKQPRRIEIAGVAGAGKSTLVRELLHAYPVCRRADSLHTRQPAHWRYVGHSLPRVGPLAAASLWRPPRLSWDETKFAIYVSEWHRYLRAAEDAPGVVLLDQGPMFALARLLWGRKPVTRTSSFRRWFDEMLRRWSRELDAVVWLDAPDEALHARIEKRGQRHEAKGRPASEAVELLGTHRRAYRAVLQSVGRLGEPELLRFDTSRRSAAEIAAALETTIAAPADAAVEAVGARP